MLRACLLPYFSWTGLRRSRGSKTYTNKPEGKTLQAVCSLFPWNNVFKDRKVPKITINGNTVTWSNLEQGMGSYILYILGVSCMYGLSITKPDGSLWISPGFTPQCLINKGTIPATEKAFFKTSIPSGKSCFFFIRTEKKADVMYTHEQIDGYHALRLHQIVRGTNPGVTTVLCFCEYGYSTF
ncbi:outer membrane protein [Escherichia coli]|uniref:Outer membrane protein n=1 Tax=Escherichia coli TaxID=562 RepID=A0A376DGB0_ECOLX|nr:outer membrane protein [Escherichia coli]